MKSKLNKIPRIAKVEENVYWGEHGLKGDSGFIPLEIDGEVQLVHASACYDAGGKVFIVEEDRQWGEIWKRMDPEEAKKKRKKIIKCFEASCDKPAVQLDHHWPYDHMMNACEEHILADLDGYFDRLERHEKASEKKLDLIFK